MAFELVEEGFVEVTVTTGGQSVTKSLDLYETNNRLYEASQSCRGKPAGAYHEAVKELLAGLGYPPVSALLADRFTSYISGEVEARKNGGGGGSTPAAAASTAPPS